MVINKNTIKEMQDVIKICETYGLQTTNDLKKFYNVAKRTNFDILLTKMKVYRKL